MKKRKKAITEARDFFNCAKFRIANSSMKRKIYRYSILGTPIGMLGFILENGWIKNSLFLIGGTMCAFGWMLGMEIEARRTLEKGEVDPNPIFGESPAPRRRRMGVAAKVIYAVAGFGLLGGIFAVAIETVWIRNMLLIVTAISCCVIWALDSDAKP